MEEIIVLATGSKDGGGSGFEKLVEYFNGSVRRRARVIGVVSNIKGGGVEARAVRLGVPYMHLSKDSCTAEGYRGIAPQFDSSKPWFALSGWLQLVSGLPEERTFNIHPALLSQLGGRFGGKGMYGHRVHDEVKFAFDDGLINCSGFTMHFVSDEYDRGPILAEVRVPLRHGMSAEDIAHAVNAEEHRLQPWLTELIVTSRIRLEGERVIVPDDFKYLPAMV